MIYIDRTTPIGKSIDAYLKGESSIEDHVIHLLFAANRWEAAARIREDITRGITIVIDRYYYSGIVYSAAKDNPELSLDWARQPEVGLPRPDLCIFLDISPEGAAKRGGFGAERYETSKMQIRVRQLFHEMFHRSDGEMVMVDAGQTMENVANRVWLAASECLKAPHRKSSLGSVEPWP